LLESRAAEQYFTGGDEAASKVFGNIVKTKEWGRTGEVQLDMGNSHGIEPISTTYDGYAEAGEAAGVRANITPVSQTSRISFGGLELETLREATGKSYLESEAMIISKYRRQIQEFQDSSLWGYNDGRLCYAWNAASSTTIYLYGLDGVALLPEMHPDMDILTGPSRKFDIVATAAPGTSKLAGGTLSTFSFSAGTCVASSAVDLSGAVGTYMIRLYNPKTALTAVRNDGLLNILVNAGSYLTDVDAAAITTVRYANWRSAYKSAGGAVLDADIAEYLLSSCVGDRKNKVLLADPKVLIKAMNGVEGLKKFNVDNSDSAKAANFGFSKVNMVLGSNVIEVVNVPRWRGTKFLACVDKSALKMTGTMIEPKFDRPSFQLLFTNKQWINDLGITSQLYTNCLRAHGLVYNLDNTTTI